MSRPRKVRLWSFYHVYVQTSLFLALRAYKQALYTLSTLTAHPPAFTYDATSNTKSLLTSFIPTLQGRGPIGSIYRILYKIQHKLGSHKEPTTSKRQTEDLHPKAIKVVDLLQHSAELGNMDALFTYAKISLVRSICPLPLAPAHGLLLSSHQVLISRLTHMLHSSPSRPMLP